MPRSDRLFDIIQRLRTASKPTTAAALAEELEVTQRTVYRDIATLQARRVPIEGAAGVGYVLRKGFDLPPLMFTIDEVEAVTSGAFGPGTIWRERHSMADSTAVVEEFRVDSCERPRTIVVSAATARDRPEAFSKRR